MIACPKTCRPSVVIHHVGKHANVHAFSPTRGDWEGCHITPNYTNLTGTISSVLSIHILLYIIGLNK